MFTILQKFTLIVIILYTSFALYNNCSSDLYSRDLQTRLTEFQLNLRCLFCLVFNITRVSSLMNSLVWNSFREISINVNKLFIVYFVYFVCLSVILYCTLLLLVYLFVPLFFYADVVAIFLFIHSSCKQAYYFYFWNFCLSF